MKRWRHQIDQDDRGQSGHHRGRRPARPGLELLEARTLLSTAHATVEKMKAPVAAANPKFPPYNIAAVIAPTSDPVGSGNVFQRKVQIEGYSPTYSTVYLAIGTRPGYFTNVAAADTKAHFQIDIPVGYGTTPLRIFADEGGDVSNIFSLNVHRGNEIEAWDSIALQAFQSAAAVPPAEAARDLAILHAAQYDAIAAIDFPNSAYQVHVTAPKGASDEAAADSSAYTVLTSLFPTLQPTFAKAYQSAVAGLPTNSSTTAGLALGVTVGNQTLANRANDGSNSVATLAPSKVEGKWRPTAPIGAAAVDSQFGQVTPFEISSGSEFRPAAPPAVGSATYDQALNEVATLGRLTNSTRTPDQTAAAEFWGSPYGSYYSPGPWNLIAEQISLARKDSLIKDARLFARLDFALADSAIASSDAQITYDEWRPINAIQQVDPTFAPLIYTPPSPSYVTDSAAYGAAAADILSATFGSKVQFTATLNAKAGVARTFSSFAAAATEDARSLVWQGVNFSFDTMAGATLGNQVAQTVIAKFPKMK